MKNKIPVQHSVLGIFIKKLLHTKIGAYLGYYSGLSGFNRLDSYVTRANGTVEFLGASYNSRVDAGAALVASLISGTTLGGISAPATAKYIALSTASLTPAKGDTTLTSETAASGMARALGTAATYTAPASLDGAASYILSKTFTASGSISIVSAAIFDATSTGNMLVEANLASTAVLTNTDTLTIQWSINL